MASFALLRDYGLPVVPSTAVTSADEAVAAARAIGGPVALKTDQPGLAHKSDVGGVRLGLTGDAEVAAAYDDLAERLGPRVVVSAMAGRVSSWLSASCVTRCSVRWCSWPPAACWSSSWRTGSWPCRRCRGRSPGAPWTG